MFSLSNSCPKRAVNSIYGGHCQCIYTLCSTLQHQELPSHFATLCTLNNNCMDIFSCLVFTPSTPDHEKGTVSKKSSKKTCHLNQSPACTLACHRASSLQNLQLITLYPNRTKLPHSNHQGLGGSIFSNFKNRHVRNK